MNKPHYNPDIHHRKSIRLKGYDYSQAGMYFITICIKHKECFFGKIENGEMILNDAGIIIDKWCNKLPEKFADIELDAYQIMPNHFHAIIINTGKPNDVGANPCVRPVSDIGQTRDIAQAHDIGQTHGSAPTTVNNILGEHNNNILGEHTGSPLHGVVQWFKTMTTNEYIRGVKHLRWKPFDGKLWQRNYYEHIIRDQSSFHNISNYIINNPAKWNEDTFYVPESNGVREPPI